MALSWAAAVPPRGNGGAPMPDDYASHRGLALASVLHRLHAAGAQP